MIGDWPRANWAGNVRYGARAWRRPESLDELRELVAAADRVRAVGSGHSFSPVADTDGLAVRLDGLPPVLAVDSAAAAVTVSASTRLGELAAHVHRHGFALANMPSLPHISAAGACATGTHGSGDGRCNLAASVSAVQLVTADGRLLELSRAADPERFPGVVVALGCLGVVTRLTLDLVPAYQVSQVVYDRLPGDALRECFAEVFAAGASVSAFTGWRDGWFDQLWVKRAVPCDPPASSWLGARPADGPRHPIAGMPPSFCTVQGGVPGPWYERLPHFRAEFTPSSGDELQSEYLLPREHGPAALAALAGIADRIAPVVHVSEIRTVSGDELWLSPSYRRDTAAIHFTWHADPAAVAPVIDAVESALAPFHPRPHWGKVFHLSPDAVRAQYPKLADFQRLRRELDPGDKFGNAFADRYLGVPVGG